MALIVETGTGAATSESYASVVFADTHHANRGNAAWADLTIAEKEAALRKATDYMLQVYRGRWKGVRKLSVQALDWPRAYVYLEPVITGANLEFPNLVADNIVPVEVQRACAEYALKSVSADLYGDTSQQVTEKTVGPITVKYDKNSSVSIRYKAIDSLLSPYLSGGSGANTRLVRS